MRRAIELVMVLALLLLAGCATVPRATVAMTGAVDAAMRGWAELSVAGQTTPELDAQVKALHARWRAACGVAASLMEAGADRQTAVESVRQAALELLNVILPLLSEESRGLVLKQWAREAGR